MTSITSRTYHRVRAFMHIWLLQAFIPISLTFTLLQWIKGTFFSKSSLSQSETDETITVCKVSKSSSMASLVALGKGDDIVDDDTESTSSGSISNVSDDNDINDEKQILEHVNEENDDIASDTFSQDIEQYVVVLTGGKMSKTLHLIRSLRSYAMYNQSTVSVKIVVLEQEKFQYSATRYSSCVDVFETITSPRYSPEAYKNDIISACTRHQATHFLPVAAPVEAVYDAQVKQQLEEIGIRALHMNSELCEILDDKHAFGCFLRDTLKLPNGAPRTYRVDSNDEVREYNRRFRQEKAAGTLPRNMILKNLSYDPIHRLDLFQLPTSDESLEKYLKKIEQDGNPITAEEPWQLQEFLSNGSEYAAMIVVRDNRLVTFTSCPSSASQLNYIHQEIPAIRTWLDDFMKALSDSNGKYILNGQLCFDFMVLREKDGTEVAYPIECNPRVHTQCSIYNSDDVRALLGELLLADYNSDDKFINAYIQEKQDEMVSLLERDYPIGELSSSSSSNKNVYWFYNELFKIFPESWLLKYTSSEELSWQLKSLSHMEGVSVLTSTVSTKMLLIGLLYLPAFLIAMIVSFPVWLLLIVSNMTSTLTSSTATRSKHGQFSSYDHAKVMVYKCLLFLERLTDMTNNIEGDYWRHDPVPFIAKNHIQTVVRLMASLRTGVEWKKVDFAIGKVVEVGGD